MRGTERPDGFSASNCQSIGAEAQPFSMQCKLNREEMYMCTGKLIAWETDECASLCFYVCGFLRWRTEERH